ncbi:hypothetical protein DSO57_1039736 [Entomophthora muscae]|uniref:Uncharacterized protein n=1 Tax=Entomophthora muscae TaxID=34485 RepID=A0ACC2RE49_9FUNG|nr:hypothetical protein DSO57_1039736 [Entomophthora muscae]
MPPKSTAKAAPKASKSKITPPKAKKAKTTPKKQPSKAKVPPKTPTLSPEQEGNSPTPPHSPFVYSLSDPQEKLFNFNCHSDPTSEPEGEEAQEPEPGAPADDPIKLWDLNSIHNICNQNGTFSVPTTYPISYPIMTKKGGAGFVYKGYSFSCNDKKKPIHQYHFKCDNVGCPARLTTYGFTRFKALTVNHDCAKPFDPLYQLICWFICQVIPTTKNQTATEVVNNVFLNLNDTQLATVGGASKLQRYFTDQRYALSTEGISASSIDQLIITEEQKLSQHEEIFLLHDDGQHAPECIICFATLQDLCNLLNCKTWLADGTFFTCPKLFSQLWNIHGQVGNLVLPLVFFFLPNKKQETYVRALTILKAKLDEILPTIEEEPKETRGRKKIHLPRRRCSHPNQEKA